MFKRVRVFWLCSAKTEVIGDMKIALLVVWTEKNFKLKSDFQARLDRSSEEDQNRLILTWVCLVGATAWEDFRTAMLFFRTSTIFQTVVLRLSPTTSRKTQDCSKQ